MQPPHKKNGKPNPPSAEAAGLAQDDFLPAVVQTVPGDEKARAIEDAQAALLGHLAYMGELGEQREELRQQYREANRQFQFARERRGEIVQQLEQLGAPLPTLRRG